MTAQQAAEKNARLHFHPDYSKDAYTGCVISFIAGWQASIGQTGVEGEGVKGVTTVEHVTKENKIIRTISMIQMYIGNIRKYYNYREVFNALEKAGFNEPVCDAVHKLLFHEIDSEDIWSYAKDALKKEGLRILDKQFPAIIKDSAPDGHSWHNLADAMEDKGVKITFGIQPDTIKRIEEYSNEYDESAKDLEGYENGMMKYSKSFWDRMGKEAGWCAFTLALYYFEYAAQFKSGDVGMKFIKCSDKLPSDKIINTYHCNIRWKNSNEPLFPKAVTFSGDWEIGDEYEVIEWLSESTLPDVEGWGWVSVEDEQKPNESQRVIVFSKYGIFKAIYSGGKFARDYNFKAYGGVTHWQPLPSPPLNQ